MNVSKFHYGFPNSTFGELNSTFGQLGGVDYGQTTWHTSPWRYVLDQFDLEGEAITQNIHFINRNYKISANGETSSFLRILVWIHYLGCVIDTSKLIGFPSCLCLYWCTQLSQRVMLGQPNPYQLNEEFNTDMSPRPGTYFEFLNSQYNRWIFKKTQIWISWI